MTEYANLTHGQYCAFKVIRVSASPKREICGSVFRDTIDADGVYYRDHIKALVDKGFLRLNSTKSGGAAKIIINKDVP